MDDNTQSWLDFAMRPFDQGGLGLAKHQAAGLVGNLQQESGGGIPAWGPTGDNRTAWGSAQWRGDRLNSLKAMFPNNYQTPEAQQAFMRHELTSTHSGAYDALKAAGTPDEAANVFNRHYEISADRSGQRAANARALMGDNPVAAINAAAGVRPGGLGTGALGFAGDDGEDAPDPTGALSSGNTLGAGALKQLMQGDEPNKLNSIGAGLSQIGASLAGISSPGQAAALSAQAAQLRKDGKSDYKMIMGADGTLYRMDDSGNISAVKTGSSKHTLQQATRKDANGNEEAGAFDPQTGQYTWPQGGPQAPPQPTTPEDLQAIDPSRAAAAQAVFEGRAKLPTGSRINPQQAQLRKDVFSVYPGIDENNFTSRNAYSKNYGTDQPSQPGGQAVGLGHSLDILDQLGKNYVKQNNWGPALGLGTTMNSIKNAQTFGGDAAATANAGGDLAYRLSTETGRLYSGNQGGGVHEREATMKRFGGDTQNLTPTQQAGLLREQRDVLTSRQEELERQRDNLFGNDENAAKRYSFRDAKTQKSLAGINETIAKLDPNGPEAMEIAHKKGGSAAPTAAAPTNNGQRPPLASFF